MNLGTVSVSVKPLLEFLKYNVTLQSKPVRQRNLTLKEKELISKFRHLLKDLTPGMLKMYWEN